MSHFLQLKWLDLNPLNGISTDTAGVQGFKKMLSLLHQYIHDSSQRFQILSLIQKLSVYSHLQITDPLHKTYFTNILGEYNERTAF